MSVPKRQLSSVGLFQGLDAKQLQSILRVSGMEEFEPGAVIFEEGDEGEELYLILDGKVRISRHLSIVREEALAVLEKGQACGEMSVIVGTVVPSPIAMAHEACTLLVVK